MMTISSGLFPEIILVQLFSRPQQVHASITNIDPIEKEKALTSSNESNALEMTIRTIAAQSIFLILSLKTINAMSEVATISKLFRRDAFAAVALLSPVIMSIGAAISRITIRMVYGRSFFVRGFSSLFLWKICMINIPIPAPR